MDILDKIIKAFPEEQFIKADGFDEAIIGIEYSKMSLVYSVGKAIQILCRDMSEEDAWEHFGFNVVGSYVGEKNPFWVYDIFK